MKIDHLTPDDAILKEFAQRLRALRKQSGLTQAELAGSAGLGVATLRRIEDGQDAQMVSWLKILRALSLTSAIDAFIPQAVASPRAEALARHKRNRKREKNTSGPQWGDEQP